METSTIVHWTPWKDEHGPVLDVEFGQTDPKESSEGNVYNLITMRMYFHRESSYWVWNVLGLAWMITSTLFIQFSMEVSDVSGRGAYAAAILLANVGLKSTLSERLPVLPYLTFLDLYLMFVNFFTILFIAEAGFVMRWPETERVHASKHCLPEHVTRYVVQGAVDWKCCQALLVIWLFLHVRLLWKAQARHKVLCDGRYCTSP